MARSSLGTIASQGQVARHLSKLTIPRLTSWPEPVDRHRTNGTVRSCNLIALAAENSRVGRSGNIDRQVRQTLRYGKSGGSDGGLLPDFPCAGISLIVAICVETERHGTITGARIRSVGHSCIVFDYVDHCEQHRCRCHATRWRSFR